MAIELKIQFNGKQLTIPINPEELNLSRSADNEDIDIIGIGKATRKGEPGLYNLEIESFFPGKKSYFYTGVKPKTCVEFIDTIWKTENKNNNVAKIITTGLTKNLNMYFVIENFEWNYRAGEEDDIYYTLEIKEYRPYGVKLVKTKKVKGETKAVKSSSKSRTSSTSATKGKAKTYKVQQGDCLWNIAKAASGNGNNWRELYNLNKKVIGTNPNLIKPGQILTLPDGWKGSFKVAKLTNKAPSNSVRSTPVTTPISTSSASSKNNKATSNSKKIVQGPVKPNTNSSTYTRNTTSATQALAQNKTVRIVTNPTTKQVTKFSSPKGYAGTTPFAPPKGYTKVSSGGGGGR